MKDWWILRFDWPGVNQTSYPYGAGVLPEPTKEQMLKADYVIRNGIYVKDREGKPVSRWPGRVGGKVNGSYASLTQREIGILLQYGVDIPQICLRRYSSITIERLAKTAANWKTEHFVTVTNHDAEPKVGCQCGTKNPVGQGHSHWCRDFRQEF